MERTKSKTIILTASSIGCLFGCQRKYFMSYQIGWRKRVTEDALKFGTAFHKGLEVAFMKSGDPIQVVFGSALKAAIDTAGSEEFDAETSEQLSALLGGYLAKWRDDGLKIDPECEFSVKFPFMRGVVVCGKMDGIVTLPNGNKAIIEHKTTSEDIGVMSDYWQTINRDQVAIYKAAAESQGLSISSVIYDVIRKPTIRRGKDESAEEYGRRLTNDCIGSAEGDNPRAKGYKRGSDFYFARREIPLLDCDMDALARRLYAAANLIRHNRRLENTFVAEGGKRSEAWPKCGSSMMCRFCPFRGVCDLDELPEGEWDKGRMFEELTVAKKYQ